MPTANSVSLGRSVFDAHEGAPSGVAPKLRAIVTRVHIISWRNVESEMKTEMFIFSH